jgi:hypothetical protein
MADAAMQNDLQLGRRHNGLKDPVVDYEEIRAVRKGSMYLGVLSGPPLRIRRGPLACHRESVALHVFARLRVGRRALLDNRLGGNPAKAIPLVTRADPTATHGALTEGYLTATMVNCIPLGNALVSEDLPTEGVSAMPKGYLVDRLVTAPGYFRTMSIRLFAGRDFDSRDNRSSRPVTIVARWAAQVRLRVGRGARGPPIRCARSTPAMVPPMRIERW